MIATNVSPHPTVSFDDPVVYKTMAGSLCAAICDNEELGSSASVAAPSESRQHPEKHVVRSGSRSKSCPRPGHDLREDAAGGNSLQVHSRG